MSRGLTFEFEDVVADCDDRVVIDSTIVPTEWLRRMGWRGGQAARMLVDKRSGSGGDELAFAMAQSPTDLVDHMAFLPQIRAADLRAAYIEEMWIRNVPLQPDVRRFLAEFDHVFLGCEATVGPAQEHLDVPVSYLPPAVDQIRFGSSPWPPTAIDIYAMGRRQPQLHDALLDWTRTDPSRFYLYDTFAGNVPIADHRQHRAKLADLIRRSRFFIANEAKVDEPGQTGRQSEVGYRFFEGAAGGAVMIGCEISAPAFDQLFPWPDAVVVVDESGADAVERLIELEADTPRWAEIRRRNASGSLRRHDPAHRWRTVLDTLGLDEPVGVGERIGRLEAMAETVDPAAADAGTP
ncbi:MAG: glycosyltransferase [Acidimicrobiia bacterium]|nr:glycosyltransferase [Acidimicrobiia bacterium]